LGYRHLVGVANRLLAETLDGEEVTGHIEGAITCLREIGAKHELAKACVFAAAHKRRRGRANEATLHLAEAVSILEQLGRHEEAARIRHPGP
jgi:plasmid replication initiation protein